MGHTMTNQARVVRGSSRRGLAMMLVVIALAVGTVIAGVALSSRSVAPQLGANAQAASQAKWSAESAAQFAVAALETNLSLSSIQDGSMAKNFTIGGGTVEVTLTDLDGEPPTDATREVIVTTTATVGGIPSIVRKQVSLNPPPQAPAAIDPYLSEFALFAENQLVIEDKARIQKWARSRERTGAAPVKVGTGFSAYASVDIKSAAQIKDSAIYVDATASPALQNVLRHAKFVSGTRLDIDIPARHVATPATISALSNGGSSAFTYTSGKTTFTPAKRYTGMLTVRDEACVVLDEAVSPAFSFGGVFLDDRATLVVKGNVDLEVNGPIYVIDGSAIYVEPGGSLDIYLRGSAYLNASTICPGEVNDQSNSVNPDTVAYRRPDAIRILSPASSYANQAFTIDNDSVVIASIHMPATALTLVDKSTLVGRATAKSIKIGTECGVYADTSLDNRAGFTNLKGPLYDDNGNLISGVLDLLSGVLSAGKTAEQIIADINAKANAGLAAAEPTTPGTTARNSRSTVVIQVPIASMMIERRADIDDDAGGAARVRVAAAEENAND